MASLTPTDPPILTVARKSAAPYLPPPLLQLIHASDEYFHIHHTTLTHEHCNDEPSMAILAALFLAYIVLRAVQGMWAGTTRRSTAHLGGGEETVLGGLALKGKQGADAPSGGAAAPPFAETVVLCGASNAGKTALLHYLCNAGEKENAWDPPMTVTSTKANVGYISQWEDASDDEKRGESTIRVIDYPGHPSLSSLLTTLLFPSATSRLVFALDSTQPVTVGAELLYQSILTHAQIRQSWSAEGKTLAILVVCTKNDVRGAKNYKRMKIQLRNELDKLRKVDLAISESANGDGAKAALKVKGKSIDLDDLGSDVPVSLHFVETGFGVDSGKGGLDVVREFVLAGTLPSAK
ncbi:hypothetical protein ACHAXT_010318 [Thalassiosira profunda]